MLMIEYQAGYAERTIGLLNGERVDLSHRFGEDTIHWVTAGRFKRTAVAEGVAD